MVVNYRRTVDDKAGGTTSWWTSLHEGSVDQGLRKVQIIWKRKEKSRFAFWGRG